MSSPRSQLKNLVGDLLPPGLVRAWRRRRGTRFTGRYENWAAARAASSGYDDSAIFERALGAARAVRDGRAMWERDSVLFHSPEANWPVLAGLLRSAARSDGQLAVVDFGGAFGSVWWQHRRWLEELDVHWRVVEQPPIVAAGRREIACGALTFHETIDAAGAADRSDTLLLSSVLPYLAEPHALLAEVVRCGFRCVIVDRTGFTHDDADRLTVQHVAPEIYPASYPCWFLRRAGVLAHFTADYRVVAEWTNVEETGFSAEFGGFVLERISL